VVRATDSGVASARTIEKNKAETACMAKESDGHGKTTEAKLECSHEARLSQAKVRVLESQLSV
jgi:hypothetical protein